MNKQIEELIEFLKTKSQQIHFAEEDGWFP